MIKFKLFLLFMFFNIVSYSQDTIRVKHINYTTIFSKSKHYPVMVDWWITKSTVLCKTPLKRKNNVGIFI